MSAAARHTPIRVVFDLDDTLYAERDFAVSGFRAAGAWAARRFGIVDPAQHMTELLDSGHLGELFKLSLSRHHPGATEEDVAQFIDVYRRHEPALSLFEDAPGALDACAALGPMGLITDGTHWVQASKVKALGIAPLFREIIYTGALGGREFHKPHPLAFERMEAALGSGDVRLVYVGDNAAKDFVAPNARGWVTVQVVRENGLHDHRAVADGGAPHHRISSLRDLAPLLLDVARR